MMTWRVIGPTVAKTQTINGRSYSGTPGGVYDVVDADAAVLVGAGWTKVCPSGPTSSRPTVGGQLVGEYFAATGTKYFDTTLGALIVYDGAVWRNPSTGALA